MFTEEDQTFDLYYKYIGNLQATPIEPDNSKISHDAMAGSVLKSVSVTNGSGQYNGWKKMTLTANKADATVKSQDIYFTAEGLQRKVTLALRSPLKNMKVEVPESVRSNVNETVEVKITLPTDVPEQLFPLRLFISSQNNTLYATGMPVEIRNNTYGFIKEVSFSEAYDVTYDENKNENRTSKIITCYFLTNCEENATTVHVDNEYLYRGSDSFINIWQEKVELETGMGVDIEKVYGRWPETFDKNSDATKEVTVELKDETLDETIRINSTSVISGMDFVSGLSRANINGTLSPDDEVVFTFTD